MPCHVQVAVQRYLIGVYDDAISAVLTPHIDAALTAVAANQDALFDARPLFHVVECTRFVMWCRWLGSLYIHAHPSVPVSTALGMAPDRRRVPGCRA